MTNNWWIFRKHLWPSQNIWILFHGSSPYHLPPTPARRVLPKLVISKMKCLGVFHLFLQRSLPGRVWVFIFVHRTRIGISLIGNRNNKDQFINALILWDNFPICDLSLTSSNKSMDNYKRLLMLSSHRMFDLCLSLYFFHTWKWKVKIRFQTP